MLSADGWVTRAAAAPRGSAPQTHCSEGGAWPYWRDFHLHLHHPSASTGRLLMDTALQVQTIKTTLTHAGQKLCWYWCHIRFCFLLSPTLPKNPVTGIRPVIRGHAPAVPQVHTRSGPTAYPSTNGLQQLTGHPNRAPSVPRWLDSWNLTCDNMMTSSLWLKHALVYMSAHAQSNITLKRHTGRRNCYLSWVGVYWKMCFSCSLSHQPQQTGLLSMKLSTGARDNRLSALSSFHLSPFFIPPFPFLPSCILFYCLPEFPSCNNRYFPFSPYFFSCVFLDFSSFTGSSPAFGLSLIFLPASFPLCSPMVL